MDIIRNIHWKHIVKDVAYILLLLVLGMIFFIIGTLIFETMLRGDAWFNDGAELPLIYKYIATLLAVVLLFKGFYRCAKLAPDNKFTHLTCVALIMILLNLFPMPINWILFLQNTAIVVVAMLVAYFINLLRSKTKVTS